MPCPYIHKEHRSRFCHGLLSVGLCLLLAGLACSGSPDAAPPSTDEAGASLVPHLLDQRPQPWKRRPEPILSAGTTKQLWSKVVLYTPHVLHRDGKFKMWYLGTSTGSRARDIALGYAESDDGIEWREHKANPILTGDDLPWGSNFQTPFVLFDDEEHIYKMWFVSVTEIARDEAGQMTEMTQALGYATSSDGIQWRIHPEPIYESGRSPSVIKEGPERYRMWMGSRPSPEHPPSDLYKNVYEFTSTDGIGWTRSDQPVLRPTGRANSTVYPFVLRQGDTYYMWYGCHLDGGTFEIFCATSSDGTNWDTDHSRVAFPASHRKDRFDGRYTSTPSVLSLEDRYLMYYSARDWQNEYIDNKGRTRTDSAGVYGHIGVAVLPKQP